jgi:hypothetical protein
MHAPGQAVNHGAEPDPLHTALDVDMEGVQANYAVTFPTR